jgi:hypothetical protein
MFLVDLNSINLDRNNFFDLKYSNIILFESFLKLKIFSKQNLNSKYL